MRNEYQGIGAIEAFDCKNARGDFDAITEKNEKQHVRLQLSVLEIPKEFSPVLMVLLII